MTPKIIQISGFSIDDFLSMLEGKINQALADFQALSNADEIEKEFYTREETAKLLNVSLSTLFNWDKDGILKKKKIGSRVFYLREEVISKLKSVA